jgi:hypothetical protein
MLSVVPLALLCLLSLAWASRASRRGSLETSWDVRDALLIGAVCTGLWGVVGTEVLSELRAFARGPVIVWWAVPVAVLTLWLIRHPWRDWRAASGPERDRPTRLFFGLAGVILALTGVIALLTPPTTPDCLSYHLPRQVFWIQQRSVEFYPSGDLRQLEMPPLAEYFGAHLMLLSGNDHRCNMVQWFAYLLGAIAASVVARDLGAGPRAQAFAANLSLLNPAAATQAVNAKNDLVVALWMLILIWQAVRIWSRRECGWCHAILAGATLGLLLLTKGTGYVLAPPVCLVMGIGMLRSGARRALPLGATIITIAAVVNAPHWSRNAAAFESPLGLAADKGGFALANETHSFAAIASSVVRNLTLHTNTPWAAVNAWQERRIRGFHRWLGIDPSDDRTTSPHSIDYAVRPTWRADGQGGGAVHLVLVLAMAIAARPGRLRARPAWPVYLIPFACALLFAIVLKWQPWHARLHIPIVAATVPLIAVWLGRRSMMMAAASGAAAIPAIGAVMWNQNKPLVGARSILGKSREEIRFVSYPQSLAGSREASEQLAGLRTGTIALQIQPGTCEYSVMRMVLDRVEPVPRLAVFQRKFGPEAAPVIPDAILVYQPGVLSPNFRIPAQERFDCVWEDGVFHVYVPR